MCMQRWYSNMLHCLSLYNLVPESQYIELRYEDLVPGLEQLSKKSGIQFDLSKLNFTNRNEQHEIDWSLNEPAKRLRNLVKQFDGDCLAKWLQKNRPKLLQRVVL